MTTVISRPRQYNHFDAEDNPVVTNGSEIVFEAQLCHDCAGVKHTTAPVTDLSASAVLGIAMQGHARKCNKKLDECHVCQRAIKTGYPSVPAPAMATVLGDTRTHTGRLSIAALTLHRTAERTYHLSKRAKADVLTAFGVLKAYESRGGGL